MTDTADDLQKSLEEFHVYCFQQKLNVNVEKKRYNFFFQKALSYKYFVEIVCEFKYLGTVFSRRGSFCKAKNHLEQSQTFMHSV